MARHGRDGGYMEGYRNGSRVGLALVALNSMAGVLVGLIAGYLLW